MARGCQEWKPAEALDLPHSTSSFGHHPLLIWICKITPRNRPTGSMNHPPRPETTSLPAPVAAPPLGDRAADQPDRRTSRRSPSSSRATAPTRSAPTCSKSPPDPTLRKPWQITRAGEGEGSVSSAAEARWLTSRSVHRLRFRHHRGALWQRCGGDLRSCR